MNAVGRPARLPNKQTSATTSSRPARGENGGAHGYLKQRLAERQKLGVDGSVQQAGQGQGQQERAGQADEKAEADSVGGDLSRRAAGELGEMTFYTVQS